MPRKPKNQETNICFNDRSRVFALGWFASTGSMFLWWVLWLGGGGSIGFGSGPFFLGGGEVHKRITTFGLVKIPFFWRRVRLDRFGRGTVCFSIKEAKIGKPASRISSSTICASFALAVSSCACGLSGPTVFLTGSPSKHFAKERIGLVSVQRGVPDIAARLASGKEVCCCHPLLPCIGVR